MIRVARVAGTMVVAGLLLCLQATPALACSPGVQALTASRTTVPAGGTVHLTGGPLLENIPANELPSTTTTTVVEGGPAQDCSAAPPPTREVSSFDVVLSRPDPADGHIVVVPLLHVEGSRLDHDVVIPASTAPGVVTLGAAGAGVDITVTRAGRLPATGASLWPYTAAAVLALSLGAGLLGLRRLHALG